MAFLNDNAFDNGLAWVQANGTRINICSAEPASFAGIAAVNLGNKTVSVGAPQNGAIDGRRVVVPAITDGAVTASGTASHWALSDGSGVLVATGPLSATQVVTNGNSFSLDAISIALRDAEAV